MRGVISYFIHRMIGLWPRLLAIGFLLLLLTPNSQLLTPNSFAKGEFLSNYNITYDVAPSGKTQVTQNISLVNQTDKFYASSFTVSISATEIENIQAFDSSGPLPTGVKKEGSKTHINVKFNAQVAGKGKEYPWTLKFTSSDFAQKQGKIWQVSLPKVASLEDLGDYSLTLSVPIEFGDPTSISPEPQTHSEAFGKLNYNFTKNQLSTTGVLANFGQNQFLDFTLTYHLKNNSFLPQKAKIPLPPDTSYQEVIFKSISPKPENVVVDNDGNFLAIYNLLRRQTLNVKVDGVAKLYLSRRLKSGPLTGEEKTMYTRSQKYWEKQSQPISTKLSEIFKAARPDGLTNHDKAKQINSFVVENLSYSHNRLDREDFQRLGAQTALSNPNQALCQEFSDLFITLARAADIPARELVGFAYTPNNELRPLSFGKSTLHAWPEYYDPLLGWVMIDPTWQQTTGGVNYFSKFDLNHFVIGIRGERSEEPTILPDVDINFSEEEFVKKAESSISIESEEEIFAYFPHKARVKIENLGNSALEQQTLSLTASKVNISQPNSTVFPKIPPFGHLEQDFDLRTNQLWESFEDILELRVGEQIVDKKIIVKPFFQYKYFWPGILSLVSGIGLLYGISLLIHWKTFKPKV